MIDILTHTRDMLVEKIMALIGRSSRDPVNYRRILYGMEISTLSRLLKQLEATVFADVKISPLPSLTENAGVIARADTGTVPDSERETLLLELVS